jgi:hypothetical protein
MSYAIGSVLSVGSGPTLEQVIVLSDGRVATKLFAGKPVVRRDILSLSDWLILAQHSGEPSPAGPSPAGPSPASPATNEAETYAMGTRLRWSKDDKNWRTAIIIKNGLLQVKEVIDSKITMELARPEAPYETVKKTFFNNVAEWRASLPASGTVASFAGPQIDSIEAKAKKPVVADTDAGYIAELSKRYLVRSQVYQQSSMNEKIEYTRRMLKSEIQGLKLDTSVENRNIDLLISSIRLMEHYAKWLKRQVLDAQSKTPQELSAPRFQFKNYYKQKLFAYKNGLKYEICTNKNGIIALAPSPEGTKYSENAKVGKSFAELGIEMKEDGKPRLEVSYYRKRIEL